jgi:FtsZ-interacting cell division protein ZipA
VRRRLARQGIDASNVELHGGVDATEKAKNQVKNLPCYVGGCLYPRQLLFSLSRLPFILCRYAIFLRLLSVQTSSEVAPARLPGRVEELLVVDTDTDTAALLLPLPEPTNQLQHLRSLVRAVHSSVTSQP